MSRRPMIDRFRFKGKTPVEIHAELLDDLKRLKRRKFSPYYRAASGLARELEDILDEARLLGDRAPLLAWEVADIMLRADRIFLYKVDDSSGLVSGVFSTLPDLWIYLAGKSGETGAFWLNKIKRLLKHDEWGFQSTVLEQSAGLLGEKALKKLADGYEKAAEKVRASNEFENDFHHHMAIHAHTRNLEACAKALKDPELYEEAVRMATLSDLVDHERFEIAEIYLRFGKYQRAESILKEQAETNREMDRLRLLTKLYGTTGEKQKLRKVLETRFMLGPDAETYRMLLDAVDDTDKEIIKTKAKAAAREDSWIFRGVRLLLAIGEDTEAEAMLIGRQDEAGESPYPAAYNILKELQEHELKAGMTVCLRALINDILARANYKNYKIAARHLKALVELDREMEGYPAGLATHGEYVVFLEEKHGRKTGFWKLV